MNSTQTAEDATQWRRYPLKLFALAGVVSVLWDWIWGAWYGNVGITGFGIFFIFVNWPLLILGPVIKGLLPSQITRIKRDGTTKQLTPIKSAMWTSMFAMLPLYLLWLYFLFWVAKDPPEGRGGEEVLLLAFIFAGILSLVGWLIGWIIGVAIVRWRGVNTGVDKPTSQGPTAGNW